MVSYTGGAAEFSKTAMAKPTCRVMVHSRGQPRCLQSSQVLYIFLVAAMRCSPLSSRLTVRVKLIDETSSVFLAMFQTVIIAG